MKRERPWLRWVPWIIGAGAVAAVVVGALHFSEARQFVHLTERAEPWWMLVALALQAATYSAQGEVLACVSRAGGFPLRLATWYELSVAKLFVDQAVPSVGVSGMVVVARSLEERGVPRTVVAAATVVDIASCYAAYVLGLGVALLLTALRGEATTLIVWISSFFILLGIALTATVLGLSGRPAGRIASRLRRLEPLARMIGFLGEADLGLARKPRLLALATAWQIVILLLDSATVWVLIRALGAHASASGVFASFMISTVFRIIGVLPGGLGTFEASSVLTLKMIGVGLPVALSATLLFRGLSFWLPMLPGMWCSRRAMRAPG
ncbi:MAG TPA: lysylphosphatidylglycerol synthase transmembrane domain-containing protein [Polyangia bacterium]